MANENTTFGSLADPFIIPDYYVFRMLYSQGVSLDTLGIPWRNVGAVEADHRKIWQTFAEHFYLFCGTLSGVWLAHELYEFFGIEQKPNGATAQATYDELADMLGELLMTLEVADTSATGAGLLGLYALGLIDAASLRVERTVESGPVFTPDPGRHKVYKQHHREYRVLRHGMVPMGEALENLEEGFL